MDEQSSHLTLEQFCSRIQDTIAAADLTAWITAEVAQVNVNRGHYYISLVQKSEFSDAPVANLRCQIWSRSVAHVLSPFRQATGSDLQAGIKILALVSAEFHPVYGLSAQILAVDPNYTIGDLERRRQEIWQRLLSDGVTDMNKSLDLPLVVKRIAVISAATAAGYGDFCNQLSNNAFGIAFRPTLFPAAVQGDAAEASVISALNVIAMRADEFDVAVIIRGGGSKMDLACFDSYQMASNVAQFPLPVLTGIGHDRDTSIVDLVAHTQLKTPTAVAEFLIQHDADFLAELDSLAARAANAARNSLSDAAYNIRELHRRLLFAASSLIEVSRSSLDNYAMRATSAVSSRLNRQELIADNLRQRILTAARNRIAFESSRQDNLAMHVNAIDPREVLRRGFSVTTDKDGKKISSPDSLQKGDTIVTHFADGKVTSVVS